jgi:hypothetical protein
VNGHLEHLLSKLYDGALAPEHLADLRKSGLTDDTIAAQLMRSAPLSMIAPLLGFDLPGIRSALLFPFRSPAGGFMDHVRVKVFPTLTDAAGHSIKYLQPKGTAPRLYFVTRCLPEVLEGEAPLWLVEGEKKAVAAAQLGLPAVGFCGVDGWHVRGSRALLADFDTIPLDGRLVEVVPDGDFRSNTHVARAIRQLGAALTARGTRARVVILPSELPR